MSTYEATDQQLTKGYTYSTTECAYPKYDIQPTHKCMSDINTVG